MAAVGAFAGVQTESEAGSRQDVSVAVYRSSSFRPDLEYVQGKLLERNVGEKPHGRLQRLLIVLFGMNEDAWNVEAIPEQRVQVAEEQYRIPDLCILPRYTQEPIVCTAPLLCIEILSRDDRMSEMQERVDDYLKMGVPIVWILDPWARRAFSIDPTGTLRSQPRRLTVSGTAIEIDVLDLFHKLDQLSATPA